MDSFLNALSDSVLAKPFASCSARDLEQLSTRYPYAAALQLLYARRLKADESVQFDQQWQKTLLLVNNPLLINHMFQAEPSLPLEAGPAAPTGLLPDTAPAAAETVPVMEKENPVAEPGPATLPPVEEPAETETAEAFQEADASGTEDMPPLPVFKMEAIDPATTELSFTPYHTIDYFAAQGIQLGAETTFNDAFGNQLKSFTEWLKHMKRLPGTAVKTNLTAKEEQQIEKMAAASLAGENANTEAMARVWIQQGNKQKAIDIYKKLSLQNPAKSAYFAAKIDHLKNSK